MRFDGEGRKLKTILMISNSYFHQANRFDHYKYNFDLGIIIFVIWSDVSVYLSKSDSNRAYVLGHISEKDAKVLCKWHVLNRTWLSMGGSFFFSKYSFFSNSSFLEKKLFFLLKSFFALWKNKIFFYFLYFLLF